MLSSLRLTSSKVRTLRVFSNLSYKNTNSNLQNIVKNMPRDSKHVSEAQKQRLKIKEKAGKYTPGTVTLQVLGSGAEGSPSVLYLFTDQSRYLFNCGEGTQRLAHEHKMKLARLEHVFITRRNWERLGGLPGLALTVQDSGVPMLKLHGPQGLEELFSATRRFVVLRDLKVESVKSESSDCFEDAVMTVNYVPIKRNIVSASTPVSAFEDSSSDGDSVKSDISSPDDTDYYSHERSGRRTTPPSIAPILKSDKRVEDEVTAYICRLKPKMGALSLERCVEQGVKPGPLLSVLKAGNDITLPNGKIVKAKDVRMPDDPGPIFIVLDIPSEEYLESLENSDVFKLHQNTATKDEDLALLIVHFSPPDVINNERYMAFMNKFSPSVTHLLVNSHNKFSGSVSIHRIQVQLNQVNDKVFPLLKEPVPIKENGETVFKSFEDENKMEIDEMNLSKSFVSGSTMCCYHLRPKKGLDRSIEPIVNPAEYILETQSIDGFKETLCDLKENLKQCSNITKEYPRIIFLGTGSCIPNKTRNTSSILILLSDTNCILLDCGEGTFGQIIRYFGFERAKEIMKNLNSIYISHLHADHHIGLIGVLQGRRKMLDSVDRLTLFAPKQIESWLHLYDKRFESIHRDFKLIPNQNLLNDSDINISSTGLSGIKTCFVRHCPHAFGVAITTEKGQKITYSGDTMPCQELVELGLDSDLLIHEATMEDDLENEAKIKMHSTVSQAIDIGNKMKAKNIVLTHFSQRYAKLPRIQNDSLINNVGLAFDNMEFGLEDLSNLPLLYPSLKLMFSEHCDELEIKAAKRAFKKQRLNTKSRESSPEAKRFELNKTVNKE